MPEIPDETPEERHIRRGRYIDTIGRYEALAYELEELRKRIPDVPFHRRRRTHLLRARQHLIADMLAFREALEELEAQLASGDAPSWL